MSLSLNRYNLFKLEKKIKKINKYFNEYKSLSNKDIKGVYNKIIHDGSDELRLLALAKVALKLTNNISLYNVQIVGVLGLNRGYILDMKTGEGKTFVAICSAFLKFSTSNSKNYIITANEYLAKRDFEISKDFFELFGIKTNYISPTKSLAEKKIAYSSSIIYTNSQELIFDYLRDNLAYKKEDILIKNLDNAIIDEADFVLLDDAKTPFVITGDSINKNKDYYLFNNISKLFSIEKDFERINNSTSIKLTSSGYKKLEKILIDKNIISNSNDIYSPKGSRFVDLVINAIHANEILIENTHYVVDENKIILVDEKTGRLSGGSQYKNGLHQAVEAKETLEIKKEQLIRSSISLQNFLKKFKTISGMSGTAITEAKELYAIYSVKVLEIPPNKKIIRKDNNDLIFYSIEKKNNSIINKVKDLYIKRQPVIVCASTIEYSETLSSLLSNENIPHVVLNAKNHAKESEIISSSGKLGSVSIVTNMAGRGTDIILGGGDKREKGDVLKLGGLFVLGAERNESRRLDNQLIGRSGRQGDAGETQFYVSLDDRLLSDFSDNTKLKVFWDKFGLEKEENNNAFLSKSVLKVQKIVDGLNHDTRKNVAMFDDINEEQRNIYFEFRNKILNTEKLDEFSSSFASQFMLEKFSSIVKPHPNQNLWDLVGFEKIIKEKYGIKININNQFNNKNLTYNELKEKVLEDTGLKLKEKIVGFDDIDYIRKKILSAIDEKWSLQLSSLNDLRRNVQLRGYAQEKPLDEYKKEMLNEFNNCIEKMKERVFLEIINLDKENKYNISEMKYEDVFNLILERTQTSVGIGYIYGVGV
jgi:preprotein translocase subunit SecA